MYLYVSGPYSGDIERNVAQARQIAIELWQTGHAVLCPHLNTNWPAEMSGTLAWEDFIRGDLQMIARVDGLVMTPDWETSRGAVVEQAYAVKLGTFAKPLAPSNESLEDAYMDAAVYSIIGLLLRRGVWGK